VKGDEFTPPPHRPRSDAPVEGELSVSLDDPVVAAEIERAARAGSRKMTTFIVIAVVIFVVLQFTPAGDRVRDWPAIYELMAGGDLEAALWFVGLTIVLMALGTPRLLFYGLAGFAFGFWEGLGLAIVGSLIASWLVFRVARWAGRDWLRARLGHHRFFARIVGIQPTALSVALVRCLPVSNLIINLALAVSRVRGRAFMLGTLVGFLPQGVVATLIGSGVADEVPWEGAVQLAVAALIVAALFGASVWRRRQGKST
jgi:uncharacterized membrane protein YdjX (TVP38/TMEM64 family)